MFKKRILLLVSSILLAGSSVGRSDDSLSLVDPMVGTDIFNGALYPGAALPSSMVKLSPDTTKPSTAGYNPSEPIIGFSHTHIGGTGGAAMYGQIRVRPESGELNVSPPPSPKKNETTVPGFYAVDLTADHVHAELTCTERAGFHRYTFAPNTPARVLIDVSSVLVGGRPYGSCAGCSANYVSDREVTGQTSIRCGYGIKYDLYFVATFDQPVTARGIWIDGKSVAGVGELKAGDNQTAGIYAEFAPGAVVNLRVGISYTSIETARKNLEPAAGLTFDQVKSRAQEIWQNHLNKIVVQGGSDAQRRQFYTALYHTALTPTDVTGDNAGWATDAKQPVYWDIHTLWDTFRSADPLRILIHPEREQTLIQSLLAVYKKTGWLPDAWIANRGSIGFQGGTNADNVIADAVVKKLGGFDMDLAYAALHKDASETNPKVGKIFPGGGKLPPYLTLGYVPSTVYTGKDSTGHENEYGAAVSRTLEYSYNDYAVSEVAAALGKADDAEKFQKQSLSAYALFHPEKKLFWGKSAAGQWMPDVDPKKTVLGWTPSYYEGSAWQYRFSMPHDVAGLITRYGGKDAFVAVLDEYFDSGLHWPGNEPGFLTPWLYIYAGRPDKTVDRVRAILAKEFKLRPSGYPGDDDVGAMSAWYIFGAMGFFPNAGQDVYLIGSPLFSSTTLSLGATNKTLVIEAKNLSSQNKYVQAATLNGKPWDKAWFRHGDIINGAQLVLTMGPKPTEWGTRVLPPSLSTEK